MAKDLTSKQVGFVNRHITAIVMLLDVADTLNDLRYEWDANAYATGAVPLENNISDAIVQIPAPHITAEILNESIGAVVSVLEAVAANRGYLEEMRP